MATPLLLDSLQSVIATEIRLLITWHDFTIWPGIRAVAFGMSQTYEAKFPWLPGSDFISIPCEQLRYHGILQGKTSTHTHICRVAHDARKHCTDKLYTIQRDLLCMLFNAWAQTERTPC